VRRNKWRAAEESDTTVGEFNEKAEIE